ncbi:hypothetical protein STCU_11765 [Strigomonas culicis]|uniref:Uncharacterized protein n=1 Tax=Strigomonas culicis TaxID=28005 RepID=S9UM63_9TRYP|nr:hypothetical protein STCU_11765 [Strigomonas culicis]|eukprot:EPY15791.1 hypothetical protein STCU_11765 [Strigomonas culicis]
MVNFTAASGVTPALAPYSTVPSPYVPGPTFDATTFDGAALVALTSSTAYTDGRCAAARRGGTLPTSSLLGVYGPTTYAYTVSNYDPSVIGYYVGCYQPAKCGVVDMGTPSTFIIIILHRRPRTRQRRGAASWWRCTSREIRPGAIWRRAWTGASSRAAWIPAGACRRRRARWCLARRRRRSSRVSSTRRRRVSRRTPRRAPAIY